MASCLAKGERDVFECATKSSRKMADKRPAPELFASPVVWEGDRLRRQIITNVAHCNNNKRRRVSQGHQHVTNISESPVIGRQLETTIEAASNRMIEEQLRPIFLELPSHTFDSFDNTAPRNNPRVSLSPVQEAANQPEHRNEPHFPRSKARKTDKLLHSTDPSPLTDFQDRAVVAHSVSPAIRKPYYPRIIACILSLIAAVSSAIILNGNSRTVSSKHSHVLVPKHGSAPDEVLTLRKFLQHPDGYSLAMAPAFFGFYGYFGALAAWEDALGRSILENKSIRSVAGASAGAMAAILIAAGIPPRRAADFCAGITLGKFADFPGLGAVFRGNKFERIMLDFLTQELPANHSLQLQECDIPVAVTAFDLQSMQGKVLTVGSMARAARASATFPFLFQPVGWSQSFDTDFTFIDGGIDDTAGLKGLEAFSGSSQSMRVVNLKVEDFWEPTPPGPSSLVGCSQMVSISIQNLPQCGPWAMANGPRAVEIAYRLMSASLDVPLFHGKEQNHFELHLDARQFLKG